MGSKPEEQLVVYSEETKEAESFPKCPTAGNILVHQPLCASS